MDLFEDITDSEWFDIYEPATLVESQLLEDYNNSKYFYITNNIGDEALFDI